MKVTDILKFDSDKEFLKRAGVKDIPTIPASCSPSSRRDSTPMPMMRCLRPSAWGETILKLASDWIEVIAIVYFGAAE